MQSIYLGKKYDFEGHVGRYVFAVALATGWGEPECTLKFLGETVYAALLMFRGKKEIIFARCMEDGYA